MPYSIRPPPVNFEAHYSHPLHNARDDWSVEKDVAGEELPPSNSSSWLAGIPFSEGVRRSSVLLRLRFRHLYLLYLLGGTLTGLILLPLNLLISSILTQVVSELLLPSMDPYRLTSMLLSLVAWNWLEGFATAFAVFLLSCAALLLVLRALPRLYSTLTGQEASQVAPRSSPTSILGAAAIAAIALASAQVTIIAAPFVHALFFFTPPVLILEEHRALEALRRSTQLVTGYWRRILASLILTFLFITFASQLGVMIYLDVEAALLLLKLPLGVPGLILLTLLSQLAAAAPAPFLPLLSLVFYPGASAAHQQRQRRRFLFRRPSFIPFPSEASTRTCPHCGASLKPQAIFCHRCGVRIAGAESGTAQAINSGLCPNCGYPLLPHSRYCDICGAKIILEE